MDKAKCERVLQGIVCFLDVGMIQTDEAKYILERLKELVEQNKSPYDGIIVIEQKIKEVEDEEDEN